MLTKRRPTNLRRAGSTRRIPGELNFPQLRKEVALISDIGVLLKESRHFRAWQKSADLHREEQSGRTNPLQFR